MQSFMALSQEQDTTCVMRCPIFISQPEPHQLSWAWNTQCA